MNRTIASPAIMKRHNLTAAALAAFTPSAALLSHPYTPNGEPLRLHLFYHSSLWYIIETTAADTLPTLKGAQIDKERALRAFHRLEDAARYSRRRPYLLACIYRGGGGQHIPEPVRIYYTARNAKKILAPWLTSQTLSDSFIEVYDADGFCEFSEPLEYAETDERAEYIAAEAVATLAELTKETI